MNFFHYDASFKYAYDYIWSDNFCAQNSREIGRNLKILLKSS